MVPAMRGVSGPGCVVAGRYELLDRIGQGAMGTVWRARDQVLARDVAVKEVRLPDLMPARDRAILRERTLREARVSAKLSHPCVVTVHDVIEADGTPWIVMELVTARSLERVLAEDGPLPPRRVAETGMMLLGALASAHVAGVVHRDVKPGNVLLTRDGRAVLTDFGIAAVDGDPALTQTGMVVGTPGFCAPERIRGAPASPASDLWSLGATLYAAVEGRGPFDGHGSPMAVLTSIVHSDPPPARSAGPLEAVIGALMSKDPAQRPDAARARQLLTGAADALGAVPSAVGAAPVGPGPVSACAGPAFARAGPVSVCTGPVSAGAGSARASAGADPVAVGTRPAWAPAGGGPGGASAKTDPTGFPASGGATAVPGSGPAALPPGAGPGEFLASPPSEPFAGGAGTAQFPADPGVFPVSSRPEPFPASSRPGLFRPVPGRAFPASSRPGVFPAAGPALIPAGASLAGPTAGLAPWPVSMGAAPFPAGTGAGAGPAGRPAARPSAGRRLLAVGLAAAAVVLAGLVWWLVARPPPAGGHGRGRPAAAGRLPLVHQAGRGGRGAGLHDGGAGRVAGAPAGGCHLPAEPGVGRHHRRHPRAGHRRWPGPGGTDAGTRRARTGNVHRLPPDRHHAHPPAREADRCVAVHLPAARRGCDGRAGGGHPADRPGRRAAV